MRLNYSLCMVLVFRLIFFSHGLTGWCEMCFAPATLFFVLTQCPYRCFRSAVGEPWFPSLFFFFLPFKVASALLCGWRPPYLPLVFFSMYDFVSDCTGSVEYPTRFMRPQFIFLPPSRLQLLPFFTFEVSVPVLDPIAPVRMFLVFFIHHKNASFRPPAVDETVSRPGFPLSHERSLGDQW